MAEISAGLCGAWICNVCGGGNASLFDLNHLDIERPTHTNLNRMLAQTIASLRIDQNSLAAGRTTEHECEKGEEEEKLKEPKHAVLRILMLQVNLYMNPRLFERDKTTLKRMVTLKIVAIANLTTDLEDSG